MKLTVTFFLFTVMYGIGFGQVEFAPLGAEWYYTKINNDFVDRFFVVRVDESIAVADGQEKTLRMYDPVDTDTACVEFKLKTTTDGKVFVKVEDEYKLFLDFSVSVGDTASLHTAEADIRDKLTIIRGGYDTEHTDSIPLRVKITDVDTLFADSMLLRRFHLSNIGDSNTFQISCRYMPSYTEKLGIPTGFFGAGCTFLPACCNGKFVCYTDNDISYSVVDSTSAVCTDYISSVKNTALIDFEIFPNPIINGLLLIKSSVRFEFFEIYNLQGQLLQSGKAQPQISLSSLPQGLYVMKAKTKSGQIGLSKFLIF